MNATPNLTAPTLMDHRVDTIAPPIRLRRLLVPLDFSAASLRAYQYAVALAGCFGGELTLLHVVPPPVLPEWGYAHLAHRDELLKSAAVRKLEDFVRTQGPAGECVGELLVRAGDPHLQIPEAARQLHADILVIATHGDSPLPHCLLGNTAEEVVRRAPCPVWVVPGVTSEEAELQPALFPLRRILVGTDFSAESRKALRYGIALAREFDATLHVVHVVPTVLPADVSHLAVILQEATMKETAHRELARMYAEELPADVPVVMTALCGNPFLEIDMEALRVRAGLVVVSTHGHTGLRYLLLGCTAQRVVQHTSVPVLVVRDQEPEFIPLGKVEKALPQ
ncbi:MAG: universal stress protein [Proteobacteria bacterium]|nr:universal stress protein [Pseudomonadota bacterium]